MRLKVIVLLALFSSLCCYAQQSPFSNTIFPAANFTASGQTSDPIQLNSLTNQSTIGGSFSSGTITLTSNGLTSVTFSVLGSANNGVTYYPLTVIAPAGASTTVTATADGLYQVSLAGLTHIRFQTSGAFGATSISLTLTASPNAQLLSKSTGGGNSPVTSVYNRIGAITAQDGDYTCAQVTGCGSGDTPPTGNGFTHITNGAQDVAARAVNLASVDVTGTLPSANTPIATASARGAVIPDGTSLAVDSTGKISSNVFPTTPTLVFSLSDNTSRAATQADLLALLGTNGVPNGGTGQTNLPIHCVVLGENDQPLGCVTVPTVQGMPLVSNAAGFDPFFGALNLALTSAVSGVLPFAHMQFPTSTGYEHITNGVPDAVATNVDLTSQVSGSLGPNNGGMGSHSVGFFTVGCIPLGALTLPFTCLTAAAAGLPLQSNGVNAVPIYSALSLAGSGVSGVLPVSKGGTGSATGIYLPLTGGTLTGILTAPAYTLTAAAGIWKPISFNTNGGQRWQMGSNNTGESGSNSGSDFDIFAYSDAGGVLFNPIHITRSTGIALFSARPTFAGATPWDSLNFNPANYLPLTGGTITGTLNVTGNITTTTGNVQAVGGFVAPNGSLVIGGIYSGHRTFAFTDSSCATGTNGNDSAVLLDGSAITTASICTIQASPQAGLHLTFVKVDSNALAQFSVLPVSGTIDGQAGYTLYQQWQSVTIQFDGTNWHVIAQYNPNVVNDQPANMVLASPNGASGHVAYRTLVMADTPSAAPLASPALTGVPTAPTAAATTNTTQIATMAAVQSVVAASEIFGRVTVPAGSLVGNDSSHANISATSNCVASPLTSANTNAWQFTINVSPSNIAIDMAAGVTLTAAQVYMYHCKP